VSAAGARPALVVRCPAKVNLHLEVLGRRADGYHELRSLFAAVGLFDELTLAATTGGGLSLDVDPAGAAPGGPDNLVAKAFALARDNGMYDGGVRVTLRKRIPVGGGLGGGSADAAATLVGLARLGGARPGLAELVSLAARLGADVPYFLVGGVAWGVGRGDEVTPLADLPPWWLVLLPGTTPVATVEVYAALGAPALRAATASAVSAWVVGGGALPLAACRNDLEPTVIRIREDVAERLVALRVGQPLLAQVSGSGGTVFALYTHEAEARECGERLAAYCPIVVPLLRRSDSALLPLVGEESWRSPRSAST
jgi:4-diphosphocytidyl-2-C-methyl-D-erythritol kinase